MNIAAERGALVVIGFKAFLHGRRIRTMNEVAYLAPVIAVLGVMLLGSSRAGAPGGLKPEPFEEETREDPSAS